MPELSTIDTVRIASIARRRSILEKSDEPWAAQAAADAEYLLQLLCERSTLVRAVIDRPPAGVAR